MSVFKGVGGERLFILVVVCGVKKFESCNKVKKLNSFGDVKTFCSFFLLGGERLFCVCEEGYKVGGFG